MDGKAELFQVADTLCPSCGFTSGLNRREQESDQNADNRNNNKKFNKRKSKEIASLAPPPPI
jgi:ribosomal protein L37E